MTKATILIVEDEAIVAADLANKLEQLGYEISGATANGEEAVVLARDRRPDLVLMDIRLEGRIDGVEAAEQVRRECDLPVIYLTAHSDRQTLERAKLTEPFGYILKPFEELELETHIEMALYKHQAERKLRQSQAALQRANEKLQITNVELQAANEELQATNEELHNTSEELRNINEELHNTSEELRTASEEVEVRNEQLATLTEQLRVNNEQLEQRVVERTAQLRALAGELTQSEERERRRIAKILHDDLQQLLVAARLHLEVMREHKDSSPMRKELQRVEQLINESNDVARRLSHELSPVVLHEEGLAAALKWLARWMDQHHRLTVRIQADPAADPAEETMKVALFQSVRELLFNVVKHAGVKRAQVRMSVGPDDHLEILVSDTGRGFDPARSKAGQESSSGFGLFSIRERLHLLGGRMEVQSAPGRGSRFRLLAPRREPTERKLTPILPLPAPQSKVHAPLEKVAPDGQSRIRVLLADDHKVMRDGLGALLEQRLDFKVAGVASDGLEAIQQAGKLQPDLVVMDVNMPRMDGIEATRQITAAWPHIKVIGLTMHSEESRYEAMRKAGAVNCLNKSGPSQDLIKAIRAAVASAPSPPSGTGKAKRGVPNAGRR